jgi:hypothetical protein
MRDHYGAFTFGAWELSYLICSAPIRARNVVCPSTTEDQEIFDLTAFEWRTDPSQRLPVKLSNCTDMFVSFQINKNKGRKNERKKTIVAVLLAVIQYVLLFRCIRLVVLR